MTKKTSFKNEILLKMQHHINTTQLSILESVLDSSLYSVDLLDINPEVPDTVDNTNTYILSLYELKRSLTLSK